MRFTKLQGAGNDYVYVDCFDEPLPADIPAVARKISDRRFGVGGDGLILICPSNRADAEMRMYNADGSYAEMCGNGIRCLAKYVYEHDISQNNPLRIESGGQVLTLQLTLEDGRVQSVRVDMGEPILEAAKIPVKLPGAADARVIDVALEPHVKLTNWEGWIEASGLDPRMTCVSMGNPHAVLYCQSAAAVPLWQVGPALEAAEIFPRRPSRSPEHSLSPPMPASWRGLPTGCGCPSAAPGGTPKRKRCSIGAPTTSR